MKEYWKSLIIENKNKAKSLRLFLIWNIEKIVREKKIPGNEVVNNILIENKWTYSDFMTSLEKNLKTFRFKIYSKFLEKFYFDSSKYIFENEQDIILQIQSMKKIPENFGDWLKQLKFIFYKKQIKVSNDIVHNYLDNPKKDVRELSNNCLYTYINNNNIKISNIIVDYSKDSNICHYWNSFKNKIVYDQEFENIKKGYYTINLSQAINLLYTKDKVIHYLFWNIKRCGKIVFTFKTNNYQDILEKYCYYKCDRQILKDNKIKKYERILGTKNG
jgi:hypothetical protein